jgi:hypothetical protein
MSKNNSSPNRELTTLERWQEQFSYMEGQLLTVVDASFSEKTQREAVKSLMRTILWDSRRRLEMDVKDISISSGGSAFSNGEIGNPPKGNGKPSIY